jgi:hypothetical protein
VIFTFLRKVTKCSRHNTILKGGIAVKVTAGIALMVIIPKQKEAEKSTDSA